MDGKLSGSPGKNPGTPQRPCRSTGTHYSHTADPRGDLASTLMGTHKIQWVRISSICLTQVLRWPSLTSSCSYCKRPLPPPCSEDMVDSLAWPLGCIFRLESLGKQGRAVLEFSSCMLCCHLSHLESLGTYSKPRSACPALPRWIQLSLAYGTQHPPYFWRVQVQNQLQRLVDTWAFNV